MRNIILFLTIFQLQPPTLRHEHFLLHKRRVVGNFSFEFFILSIVFNQLASQFYALRVSNPTFFQQKFSFYIGGEGGGAMIIIKRPPGITS